MPQSPPVSPAAKRLQHILQHKLPVAHEDEAIKDVLKSIKACSKEELAGLSLQPPAVPVLCFDACGQDQPLQTRLAAVQSFISSFQYNYCTGYNYDVAKKRPLHALLATAAGILAHSLPIKCIEAVFLGILLTQGWSQLQRLPVGFKSRGSDGQVYRHIVLAVCDTATGLYGALGISRCSALMDKALQHSSLAVLVQDYHSAYRHVGHELLKVRVGLPVEHDPAHVMGSVCWRFCNVNMQLRSWQEAADLLNRHAAAAAELQQQFREAAAHSSNGSGSRSVPQSPRGSPVGPHITRPHSALRISCGTPTPGQSAEQQCSPAPTPRTGQWRSPAASACSSPGAAGPSQCRSPVGCGSGPAAHAKSPRGHRASPQAAGGSKPLGGPKLLDGIAATAAAGAAPGAGAAPEQAQRRLLAAGAADVRSSCEVETSDDEDANDSDSEVNSVVHRMLQHRLG